MPRPGEPRKPATAPGAFNLGEGAFTPEGTCCCCRRSVRRPAQSLTLLRLLLTRHEPVDLGGSPKLPCDSHGPRLLAGVLLVVTLLPEVTVTLDLTETLRTSGWPRAHMRPLCTPRSTRSHCTAALARAASCTQAAGRVLVGNLNVILHPASGPGGGWFGLSPSSSSCPWPCIRVTRSY